MVKRMPDSARTQRDLPALFDTLTVAVTTLDAIGVERYHQLYLYVVGETPNRVVRDLRVENGHLIVGPPVDADSKESCPCWNDEVQNRSLLLSQLREIMRLWGWPLDKMSTFLGCSPETLASWVRTISRYNAPVFPRSINEKIRRLAMIDLARSLSGITDQELPSWLERQRLGFGRRSIQQLLESEDRSDFCQLLLWSLNRRQRKTTVH